MVIEQANPGAGNLRTILPIVILGGVKGHKRYDFERAEDPSTHGPAKTKRNGPRCAEASRGPFFVFASAQVA
jgi:hypothetical protein